MKSKVLYIIALAIVIGGCTKNAEVTEPPKGMHLLADAEVILRPLDGRRIKIIHQVNLFNGGTDTCNSLNDHITLEWPVTLKNRVIEGTYDGVVEPFKPGDKGRHSGEWIVDVSGIGMTEAQNLKISIACGSPKGGRIGIIPRFKQDNPNQFFDHLWKRL